MLPYDFYFFWDIESVLLANCVHFNQYS